LGLVQGARVECDRSAALTLNSGNVCRNLDDLVGATVGIQNRVVDALDPDIRSVFCATVEGIGEELARPKSFPERKIFGALNLFSADQERVVMADNLIKTTAERGQEILVGAKDFSVGGKLQDQLRAI